MDLFRAVAVLEFVSRFFSVDCRIIGLLANSSSLNGEPHFLTVLFSRPLKRRSLKTSPSVAVLVSVSYLESLVLAIVLLLSP